MAKVAQDIYQQRSCSRINIRNLINRKVIGFTSLCLRTISREVKRSISNPRSQSTINLFLHKKSNPNNGSVTTATTKVHLKVRPVRLIPKVTSTSPWVLILTPAALVRLQQLDGLNKILVYNAE